MASVPYDVVNTSEARELVADNPHSFLRVVRSEIDLPDSTDPYDDSVYEAAKNNLNSLLSDGLLIKDEQPQMYLYRQVWKDHSQVGLVCCCHVKDYENELVKKHEKTRRNKEDDRTRHVLSVNANTGPVFLAYKDNDKIDQLVEKHRNARPVYHFVAPDDVTHTVWAIDDWKAYQEVFQTIDCVYVADGHHRAASAFRAGNERQAANPNHTGEEEYNWFLTVLFPADSLNILPYNRTVKDLNSLSSTEAIDRLKEIGTLSDTDNPTPKNSGSFCIYIDRQWKKLELDPSTIDKTDPINSLDVALLQDRVLNPILAIGDPRTDERVDFVGGIRGTKHLEELVDSGKAAIAFSMYPTTIQQLMAVADAGLVMPPKSTWFEPKLRSGLLVHSLD